MSRSSFVLLILFSCGVIFSREGDADTIIQSAVSVKSITVKKFSFSYSIDGAYLSAKVSFPTRGWVAVGFSPKKKMMGADIIIGSISPEGPEKGIRIDDHYGISPTQHKPDVEIGGENNIVDGSVTEKNGITTLFFTIPLDSKDTSDIRLVPGSNMDIIFAAGKQDDIATKHSRIAKRRIKL